MTCGEGFNAFSIALVDSLLSLNRYFLSSLKSGYVTIPGGIDYAVTDKDMRIQVSIFGFYASIIYSCNSNLSNNSFGWQDMAQQ